MLEYKISASSEKGGTARAEAKKSKISFDAAAESGDQYPNPAELYLSSFAACILKNVERYSHILRIPYERAYIKVKGWRSDVPPAMVKVEYILTIVSNEEDHKVDLIHRNVQKFGTIYNTVAKSCEVSGTMIHQK